MSDAIEAHGLVKTYPPDVRALDGLGFAVEQGTIFGLLGPNGAGKTTAIRVLTTLLTPDEGHASVLGHDVVVDAATVRHHIALAGQSAAVDENLTGRENLVLIGRLQHLGRGRPGARAAELLERFDLVDAANRPVKTYSGGMRRRLDLAASLVAEPPVLFLDEPTTGLDPQSRLDLWAIIARLVELGTTVLLTTQYLEEADRLSQRIAVVDRGKVIAEGTPSELKGSFGSTVLDLQLASEADAVRAEGVLDAMPTAAPIRRGTSVEIAVGDGADVVIGALNLLGSNGIRPSNLALREPSLDDVFLALTGRPAEDTALDGEFADPPRRSPARR